MAARFISEMKKVTNPTWDDLRGHITDAIDSLANVRRAALRVADKETVDGFIAEYGKTTFNKFEEMSELSLHLYMLQKLIDISGENPEVLADFLGELEEGED